MVRKANDTRLFEAQELLSKNQDEKASYYAKTLGFHRYDFNTLLAMLNDRGVHREVNQGRLWLFGQNQNNT